MRSGDKKKFLCLQKSDAQLDCNGTVYRVRANKTIENGAVKGKLDGYKSISWTNGAKWDRQGNNELHFRERYVPYSFKITNEINES